MLRRSAHASNIAMVGVIALACAASAPRPAFSENGGTLVAPRLRRLALGFPGLRRKLTPADMPARWQPTGRQSLAIGPPAGRRQPKAPPGFAVALFAKGLSEPRVVRVAPNGDIFVAESSAGACARCAPTIRPPRPRYRKYSPPARSPVRHRLLSARAEPALRLCREPDASGALCLSERRSQGVRAASDHRAVAAGRGGHWTRDIAFSADGKTMFVSVGSGSNVAQEMAPLRTASLPPSKPVTRLAPPGDRKKTRRRARFDPRAGQPSLCRRLAQLLG